MVQKKIEEKRASRISSLRKLPKVNASLAAEYMSGGEEEVDEGLDSDDSAKATNPKNKKKKKSASLLRDDRFKSMFDDADFQVDNTTLEYKLHHPSESNAQKIAKRFEPVQDEQDQENEDTITSYQMGSLSKKTKPSGPKFYELKVHIVF
jgi:ribosome biogenesis protein ENP2